MLNSPFTVVTGQGLGTSYSSLKQIGNIYSNLQGLGQANICGYVNVTNGNLIIETPKKKLPELNGPQEFYFTYNLQAATTAECWRLSVVKRLKQMPSIKNPLGNTAVLEEIDGHQTTYTLSHDDRIDQPFYFAPGLQSGTPYFRYDYTNDKWIWYHPGTQETETYDPKTGLQLDHIDAAGRKTTYEYDKNQQLTAIISPGNNRYTIERTAIANNGTSVSIYFWQDGTTKIRLQSHDFDSNKRLEKTRVSDNYEVNYHYGNSTSKQIESITQTDGTKMSVGYTNNASSPWVNFFKVGDTNYTEITYKSQQDIQLKNALSAITELLLDSEGRIVQVAEEQGYPYQVNKADITSYTYASQGEMQQQGQLSSITRPDNQQETFAYDHVLGLCTSHVHPNGQKIDYFYNGDLIPDKLKVEKHYLTDTQVASHRYVYDEAYDDVQGHIFLRFVISPEGRVTEYRPDAKGNRQFELNYFNAQFDVATFPSDYAPTYSEMKAWATEQQQKDPQGISLIQYFYDDRGQIIDKKEYAHIDSAGQGIEDEQMGETKILWDIYGVWHEKLIKQANGVESQYTQESDDLQRITRYVEYVSGSDPSLTLQHSVEPSQQETLIKKLLHHARISSKPSSSMKKIEFDDISYAKTFVEELLKMGVGNPDASLQEKSIWHFNPDNNNAKNRYIIELTDDEWKVTNSIVTQETQWTYLDTNHQILKEYPNNQTELVTYDNQGLAQTKYEVATNSNGQQQTRNTEYVRDVIGEVVQIKQPDGKTSYQFFDCQNRLGFEVSPQGIVKEYQYDRINRYNTTIRYANKIDMQQFLIFPKPTVDILQQLLDQVKNPDKDRYTYQLFDASNRLIYQVDEKQYLTRFIYDNLNRKIATIAYNDPPLTTNELNELLQNQNCQRAINFDVDRTHLISYDGDGLVTAECDAKGYVTQTIRDAAGRIVHSVRYDTPLPPDARNVFSGFSMPPINDDKDAHTYYYYDAKGQKMGEAKIVNGQGNYTAYSYYAIKDLIAQKISYATPITDETWLKNPLVAPQPILSTEDRTIVYSYDLLNRDIHRSSSYGTQADVKYDSMGKVTSEIASDSVNPVLDGDHYRGKQTRYDGWEQPSAEANQFIVLQIAQINADTQLSPSEKETQIEALWAKNTTRYIYDNSGLKLQSIAPDGGITTYYYDDDRRPVITIDSIGTVLQTTFNNSNEIIETYRYINPISPDQRSTLPGGFLTNDLLNRLEDLADPQHDAKVVFDRDKRGQVEQKTDEKNYISKYQYNPYKQCTQEQLPVGSQEPSLTIEHHYEDPRGLETKTIKKADNITVTVEHQYNNMYCKETLMIDENQGKHTKNYDSIGRMTQKTDSIEDDKVAVHSTSYDPLDRPVAETNAVNQTTQHSYNQSERTHTIINPIKNTQVVEQNNCFKEKIKSTDALQKSDQWQHDAFGNIAIAIDKNNNKTSDEFDKMNRHVSHQDANGTVTDYDYNTAGHLETKIEDVGGVNKTTEYINDAWGRQVTTIDPRGTVTNKQFDQRSDCINTIIDPSGLGLQVQKTYNGQHTETSVQEGDINTPNQHFVTFQQDGLNRPIGEVTDPVTIDQPNGLAITTQKQLDAAGQVIAFIDPNGNITRSFYNWRNHDKPRFEVNGNGGITEWQYDAEDRRYYRRDYTQKADLNELNNITTLADMKAMAQTLASNTDKFVWYFYDANGREQFQVNSLGAVTEKTYNNAGHRISECAYDTCIDPQFISTLTTDQLVTLVANLKNNPKNRLTYYIVDGKGQDRFIIDPENYVIEQQFDSVGQIIQKTSYATQISDPTEFINLPPDQVQIPTDPDHDQTIYFFFDALRQPQFNVDAEGGVIRFDHDENGNLTKTIRFKQKVNVPMDYAELKTVLLSLIPNPAVDQITESVWDAANREYKKIDAQGNADKYNLDALGQIKVHVDRKGFEWKFNYDRAKRKTLEVTPAVKVTQVTNEAGKLTAQEITMEVQKQTQYDNAGNAIAIIDNVGSPDARTCISSFDACHLPTTQEIPNVKLDDPTQVASFEVRPETTMTIASQIVRDGKNQIIAEQNFAGNWRFLVRDAEERLIYEVNSEGIVTQNDYNTFGNHVREIRYNNKITIDLENWLKKGISINDINPVPDPDNDRVKIFDHDRRGDQIKMLESEITFYLPNADFPALGYVGKAQPCTINVLNAFRKCINKRQLIDPTKDVWADEFYWFDRNNKQVALSNPNNYVKRYDINTFGYEEIRVEFANALTEKPTTAMSLAELDALLEKIQSPKDRTYLTDYNLLNNKTSETRVGIIAQQLTIENGLPVISDLPPQDLQRLYGYDAVENLTSTTYEDGSTEYLYYDARKHKIAETGVPRTNVDKTKTLVPLTYFGINAFGESVSTTRFQSGTGLANANTLPEPLSIDLAQDQTELILMDNRKLPIYQQDAEGHTTGFTYTAMQKPARQWYKLTNWSKNGDVVHIDEKRMEYNSLDLMTKTTILRDNVMDDPDECITETQYNSFMQPMAEGPGNGTWPVSWKYNQNGGLWFTNKNAGVNTITLTDLLNRETLKGQSATKDLSLITYAELPSVVAADPTQGWSVEDLERTQSVRDVSGRVTTKLMPAYRGTDPAKNNGPAPLPQSLCMGNHYPEFGATSITWTLPQERTVKPIVYLWPATVDIETHPEAMQQFTEVKLLNNRCGIDVSSLVTDVYEFRIDYVFTDPNTQQTQTLYRSAGQLQINTNNINGSQLVVTFVTDDCIVNIKGNTTGLTQIQLFKEDVLVATLPVQLSSTDNTVYQVDLSAYASGQYQLKPIYEDGHEAVNSQSFTIYTAIPSTEPLAREIFCNSEINTCDQYGQLTWEVPASYASHPVIMICNYVAADGSDQEQAAFIYPGQSLGTVTDGQGKPLDYNIIFEQPVKQIKQLYLWLQVTEQNPDNNNNAQIDYIPLMNGTAPLNADASVYKKGWTVRGQLPGQLLPLTFEETPTPLASDTVLTVLGITREQWSDVLYAHRDNQEVRHAFAEEIKEAFLENRLVPFGGYAQILCDKVLAARQVVKTALENAVPMPSYPEWKVAEGISEKRLALYKAEEELQQYCRGIRIYDYYLSTIKKLNTQWREIHLLWYARLSGQNVMVWQRDPSCPFRMQLKTQIIHQADQPVTHVLLTEAKQHFSPLKPVGFANHQLMQQPIPVPTAPLMANVTTDSVTTTSTFPQQTALYITPINTSDAVLTAQYLDTNLDRQAIWKGIVSSGQTRAGIVFDVSSMSPGTYPYKIETEGKVELVSSTFVVAHGNDVVWSNDDTPVVEKDLIQPQHRLIYDAWNNTTRETDSYGNPTDHEYNDSDKEIVRTQPQITVMNPDGTTEDIRPVTRYGYTVRDFNLGFVNARSYADAKQLDEAGQLLAHLLGNGVAIQTQELDALGRITCYWDGRGERFELAYDRLNHEIQRTSPWVKVSATDDKQYQRIDRYTYNEAGLRNTTTNPQGFTRRHVYDSRLNIQIAYEPNTDFHTKTYYDRNRQTKQRIYSNPANATVSWKRDYFGLATDPENHRDHVQLDGVVIQYTYDFKRQVLRQHAVVSGRATALELQEWSDFSPQGPMGTPQTQTYYQTIEQKLELQDLYFTYQVGRVVEVWDAVRQRKTVNGYNQEGYHVIRELLTLTGTVIRHWESQLNALNWPTLLRDTLMVMQRYYDGVGNRISEQVMLMGGENWEVIYQQSIYSTYDKANNELVNGGILKDGVIQISPLGGHLYTQSQGFRQKEQVYNLKGELVTNDLGYDGEGLLVKNGETELVYDGSRCRKLFNRPGNIIQDEYDENSWQVSSNQESAGNGVNEPLSDTVTLYSNYITEGIATVEKTNYYSDPNQTEDNLSWSLYGFDNYERRTLSGTRKDKNGDPHYVSTMEYERDGNQAYSGIKATSPNVQDPTKTDESEIVIDSTYDNLMLLKKTVGMGKTYPVSLLVTYEIPFYDPEGMYLGNYQHTAGGAGSGILNPHVSLQGIRQASSPYGPVSHGYRPQGLMNHGYDPSGYGEETSINRHNSVTLADYTQPLTSVMQSGYTYQGVKGFQAHTSLSTNYPPPTPKVYQVQAGDTFKQISQKNYTTDQYADQIQQASGLTDESQLQPGMSIELPMLISSFNNADTYFPKQDVLNNLVGNYYPYLVGPLPPPPKHQHNWWKVIVASLIDAAIIAIMPHLMPLALGISASATGWAGFFLNTAIGAASGLSTQMANDALGVSHGFSWRTFGASVIGQQLAFANPLGAKAGTLDPFSKLDGMLSKFKMLANNHILQAMEQAGRVALEEQAVQLASGGGGHLDLGAVFTQMVTAGLQTKISTQNLTLNQQAEFSGVTTFIGGELTQVVHGDRLNIAQMAAQSIGNSFGTYEGAKIDAYEANQAYAKAKAAQQGKGNPTQTSQSKAKAHTKSQMTTSDEHQQAPVSKADTWNGKVGPSKKNWDYESQMLIDSQSLENQVKNAVARASVDAIVDNMMDISMANASSVFVNDGNNVAKGGSNSKSALSLSNFWNGIKEEASGSWIKESLKGVSESAEKSLTEVKYKQGNYLYQKEQLARLARDSEYTLLAQKTFGGAVAEEIAATKNLLAGARTVEQKYSALASEFGLYAKNLKVAEVTGKVVGKALGFVEWAEATHKVAESNPEERGWVATKEYGGVVAGKIGSTVGGLVSGPLEGVAPVIATPIVIGSSIAVGSAFSASWKASVDWVHENVERKEGWSTSFTP